MLIDLPGDWLALDMRRVIGAGFLLLGALAFIAACWIVTLPRRRVTAGVTSIEVVNPPGGAAEFVVKYFYSYAGKMHVGELRHVMPPENGRARAKFDCFAAQVYRKRRMMVIVNPRNPKDARPANVRLPSKASPARRAVLAPAPPPLSAPATVSPALKPPDIAALAIFGPPPEPQDSPESEPERELELAGAGPRTA